MISTPSAPKPVVQLPRLTTPNAVELASKFKPQPGAQALLKPGQSSSEYIHTLQEKKQSTDAVNALAHGMPERDSVHWACQSSDKVADKLNGPDRAALAAAKQWVKNPNPSSQAAAAAAAAKTNYTGPGAWAAQAAAWSKGPAPAAAAGKVPLTGAAGAAAPAAAAPSLTGSAVAGSVLLAAGLVNRPAMPAVPASKPAIPTAPLPSPQLPVAQAPALQQAQIPAADQGQLSKMLNPFIDLGKDVASGKNVPA